MYHLARTSQFKLVKGDQLRVTLEAIDYRGDMPGKPTRSEPLLLNITDESGIMSALSETDLRAAHQMDLLIQRQRANWSFEMNRMSAFDRSNRALVIRALVHSARRLFSRGMPCSRRVVTATWAAAFVATWLELRAQASAAGRQPC